MRSDDPARIESESVRRLLDAMFGFFVWAMHLLVIYIWEAVACQLGRTTFVPGLVIATLIAAAIVIAHGAKRYGQRHETHDHAFLIRIAIGHDALAAVAIVWQLFAILMVPICR